MDARPSLSSATLLLFPTELEQRRFHEVGALPPGLALPAICGFGPIAASARTAELLALHKPARVLLVGIAGTFDASTDPLDSALEFDEVMVDGVGAGEGPGLLATPKLGLPQWPGSAGGGSPIHDWLALATRPPERSRLLLTVCAASATAAQAAQRRERFPRARAEDMEGFAVALACAIAGVPLRIVRGISNQVGDRAPERWRIPGALAAARELVLEILESAHDSGQWRRSR